MSLKTPAKICYSFLALFKNIGGPPQPSADKILFSVPSVTPSQFNYGIHGKHGIQAGDTKITANVSQGKFIISPDTILKHLRPSAAIGGSNPFPCIPWLPWLRPFTLSENLFVSLRGFCALRVRPYFLTLKPRKTAKNSHRHDSPRRHRAHRERQLGFVTFARTLY